MAPTQYTLRFLPTCKPDVRARTEKAFAAVDATPTRARKTRTRAKCAAYRGTVVLNAPDHLPAPKRPWYCVVEYLSEGGERLNFVAGPMTMAAAESLASQCSNTYSSARTARAFAEGNDPELASRYVVLPSQHEIQVVRVADDVDQAFRIAA